MALITKNNTFSAGSTILSAEHNENFDTIYNLVNGNIDNNNIKSSAAIVDTKLAQISTAGKVSGAAFTGLASVPAGAGTLPFANMDTIDEDDMATDSDEKVPTQQSVKAYTDTTFTLDSILDYGTSASASTAKAQNALHICYGTISVTGSGGTQAITNLPFTSATSYKVSLTFDSATAVNENPVYLRDSGTQFTITNHQNTRTIAWIAIGT